MYDLGQVTELPWTSVPPKDNGNALFHRTKYRGCSGPGLPVALNLSGSQVMPMVKEEVGFSQLDCPPEDFHGTGHLGNPGDQVSGLQPARPPSLPPSSWCGLLQPDVQMLLRPPFQLQAGGNREPYWEETTILLCAVTKYLLVSEGRPSCIPS